MLAAAGLPDLRRSRSHLPADRRVPAWSRAIVDKDATHAFYHRHGKSVGMSALTLFGLFAVSAMLVCYTLESRSHWFVLLFAVSCTPGSAYGFLQGARAFGLVETV